MKTKTLITKKTPIIMNKDTLTTLGTITKKEQLRSVDLEKCKSLLLETSNPFPGYHGHNLPEKSVPESLFLITKINYSDEEIIRAIQKIKQSTHPEFDATPCSISLQNSTSYGIRFKDLSYAEVPEVVKLFGKYGILFKDKKQVVPYDSVIHIRKFFKMNEAEDGIYIDAECTNQFYLRLPKPLTWDLFEKMTISLKYNIEDSNFDAALVYIYTEKGIVDLVRIFNFDYSIEKLKLIRHKYLEKLK